MTIILSTVVVEKRLQDIEFPLVFKICTNPSFNSEAISEAGYDYVGGYAYFRYTKRRQNRPVLHANILRNIFGNR